LVLGAGLVAVADMGAVGLVASAVAAVDLVGSVVAVPAGAERVAAGRDV